jgi:hypothetical protein
LQPGESGTGTRELRNDDALARPRGGLMTIGLGILLIVVGLVFALDVINVETSAIDG